MVVVSRDVLHFLRFSENKGVRTDEKENTVIYVHVMNIFNEYLESSIEKMCLKGFMLTYNYVRENEESPNLSSFCYYIECYLRKNNYVFFVLK